MDEICTRRKKRDKVAAACGDETGGGSKKSKPDDGEGGGGGGGLGDDDNMPVPGRARGGRRTDDRLGHHSRGSGLISSSTTSSGGGDFDRLGRIQGDWMLPANNSNISRDNASLASVASVSTSLTFTSSSSASQQQQQQQQPRSQLPKALEESLLFKEGGDAETVSTATNSLSTLFSSVAATTTEENKSASVVDGDLISVENKSSTLFSLSENKSSSTTYADLFSSVVVGATEEDKVDKLLAEVLTVSSSTEPTSNTVISMVMGSPLAGFVATSFAASTAQQPQQQQQPPIHRPNNPPITELLGGVILAEHSSVHTGVSSVSSGTVSSVGTGAVSSLLDARTVSSVGTGTLAGTGSSWGTGFNTHTEEYLFTSVFGPARPPTAAAAAAAPRDDAAERAAAVAAEQAMFKKTGVPKAAVHCWYGQKPRRQVISQENYVTWHDNGPPHLIHYTSLFICPMSGEAFGSGRYGDAKHYKTDAHDPNVVWYKRKALAEHGAAARAFDCLVFREAQAAAGTSAPGPTMAEFRIGKDEPYLAATPAVPNGSSLAAFLAVPSHVPSHLRPEVEQNIRQGQAHAPPTTTNNNKDDDDVEEAAWSKNAYERQHDHEMHHQNSQQYEGQDMPQQNEDFSTHPAHNIFDDPEL
jgi:hypothetical protein